MRNPKFATITIVKARLQLKSKNFYLT